MTAILAKELRARMRRGGAAALLTGYLAALALITFGAFGVATRQPTFSAVQLANVGLEVFDVLNAVQLGLLLFIVPPLAAGSVAGERDRQTFELLLSTRLSPFAIVGGKLVASVAFILLLMVASLPLLSLVFLFGGVAPAVLLRGLLVQAATVALLGSAGLLLSTVARRTMAATALGLALSFVLLVGTALSAALAPGGGGAALLGIGRPGVFVGRTVINGGFVGPGPGAAPQGPLKLPAVLALNPAAALDDALQRPAPHGSGWFLVYPNDRLPGGWHLWQGYAGTAGALSVLCFAAAGVALDPCPRRRADRPGRR